MLKIRDFGLKGVFCFVILVFFAINLYAIEDASSASMPYPADGDENVNSQSGQLQWDEGLGADSHDVYFGEGFDDVDNAGVNDLLADIAKDGIVDIGDVFVLSEQWLNIGSADIVSDGIVNFKDYSDLADHWLEVGIYKGNYILDSNSYSFDQLELDKAYYWRIDEVDSSTLNKGHIWHFITDATDYIDNFEIYQNDTELKNVWNDGDSVGSSSYQTNSYIEVIQEYSHRKTGQSVGFSYDTEVFPYYSEIDREFFRPLDLTAKDANYLDMWLYVTGDGYEREVFGGCESGWSGWTATGPFSPGQSGLADAGGWGNDPCPEIDYVDSYPVETGVGTFTSSVFTVDKEEIIFYGNGWDGQYGGLGLNYFCLRSASDNSILRQTYAPQPPYSNNAFIKMGWDVSELSSQDVYFQVVDGCTDSGYAWLGLAKAELASPETKEKIYVRLEDGSESATFEYDRLDEVEWQDGWKRWTIPIDDIENAGIDVKNITKLIIGVGDGLSGTEGGTGMICFDSIGLYRERPPVYDEQFNDHKPGLDYMASVEALPLFLPDGSQTKQFISHDATGGNNDGYFDNSTVKYVDENGEFVIFDEYGAGCLYR